jgi:hypothetical protein
MSTIVTEVYDALRKAGVDEQLAKDAARAVMAADAGNELATKADLARLELATKSDFSRLELATKGDFSRLESATKADLADLRTDIANMKVELIKWNVGAMAVLTAIFAAIVRLG